MKKYILGIILGFSCLIFPTSSFAGILFFDDFDSGLNLSNWTLENEGGAMWQAQSSSGNGYIQSQVQSSSDRYLDILSNQNNFSNFQMSFDINFLNTGADQDFRRIYLRTTGNIGFHEGYAINIRYWNGASNGSFITLGPYNSATLDIEPLALAQVFTTFETNAWYRFVVVLNGNNLKLKYWKVVDIEPTSWLIDVVDSNSTYSSGGIGFGNYWQADTLIDNVVNSNINTGGGIGQPPVADTGGAYYMALANEDVYLNATNSIDPDGFITTYIWTRMPGNEIVCQGTNPVCITKALGRIQEVFELEVIDNDGNSTKAQTSILSTILWILHG